MKKISIFVLALCTLLIGFSASAENAKSVTEKANRLQVAETMFQERCKKAGEKIYKTVDSVEGVFFMKVRPKKDDFADQFAMDDPYGHDTGADGYIANFLVGRNVAGSLTHIGVATNGYSYVDAPDSQDGKRYRYTGRIEEPWQNNKAYLKGYTRLVLDKTLASDESPRYGVTYEDLSTREEREHWIAGSSLKIIDLKTKEIIAERVGYMMDPGQGSRSGGHSPWLLATYHACPSFPSADGRHPVQTHQTRNFVEKVLKPIANK